MEGTTAPRLDADPIWDQFWARFGTYACQNLEAAVIVIPLMFRYGKWLLVQHHYIATHYQDISLVCRDENTVAHTHTHTRLSKERMIDEQTGHTPEYARMSIHTTRHIDSAIVINAWISNIDNCMCEYMYACMEAYVCVHVCNACSCVCIYSCTNVCGRVGATCIYNCMYKGMHGSRHSSALPVPMSVQVYLEAPKPIKIQGFCKILKNTVYRVVQKPRKNNGFGMILKTFYF